MLHLMAVVLLDACFAEENQLVKALNSMLQIDLTTAAKNKTKITFLIGILRL